MAVTSSPVWLIELGVYGSEIEPLAKEIRRQGMEYRFVTYREIAKGPTPLPRGVCAVVYGTYPIVRHAILRCGWTQGGWCSSENLDCFSYYPHFVKFLLNQRNEILPGVVAIREKQRLFSEYGRDGFVFARPTSDHKLFVGRLIAEDDFEASLAPTRYDSETQIVIALPQTLGREWRLVIAGDEIVSGSQYAEFGVRSMVAGCPGEVLEFTNAMLAEVQWRPDELFMLDVCETGHGLRLVELNSFSCSWIYASNFTTVVEVASRLASNAWERTQAR